MDENGEILKFKKRFDRTKDMAPIEHVLIGSGISINGELFNFEEFAKQSREKKLYNEAFIPKSAELSAGNEDIVGLQLRRMDQKELAGMLPFLDEKQLELGDYKPFLELAGPVHETSGRIDPVWMLSLIDKSGVKVNLNQNMPLLDKLSLDSRFAEFFRLNFMDEDNQLILELKDAE